MWEGKDGPQPDLLSDLSQTWKEQHPDWTYIFWNGEKIDAFMAGHAEYRDVYNSYPYAVQRWDMIRYLILYEYDEQRQLAIAREGAMKAGREEGRAAEQVTIIRNMAGKGLNPSAIADMLGLEEGYVKKVLYLLAEETGRTDLEIAGILLEQRQEG